MAIKSGINFRYPDQPIGDVNKEQTGLKEPTFSVLQIIWVMNELLFKSSHIMVKSFHSSEYLCAFKINANQIKTYLTPTKKYFLLFGVYSGSHSSSFGLFWKVVFELFGPVFVPAKTPLALPLPLIRNWLTLTKLFSNAIKGI